MSPEHAKLQSEIEASNKKHTAEHLHARQLSKEAHELEAELARLELEMAADGAEVGAAEGAAPQAGAGAALEEPKPEHEKLQSEIAAANEKHKVEHLHARQLSKVAHELEAELAALEAESAVIDA